ncbi:MAG: hypothetical protein M3N17_08020 [Actinomycetota bacterium]|nr:hypothetical protein [Actinomycetota bacterium]
MLRMVPDAGLDQRVTYEGSVVHASFSTVAASPGPSPSWPSRRSIGDVAVEGLFRQVAVIRVETLDELFNVAAVVSRQPVPRNDRVAVPANGRGRASWPPAPAGPTVFACLSWRPRRPGDCTTDRHPSCGGTTRST